MRRRVLCLEKGGSPSMVLSVAAKLEVAPLEIGKQDEGRQCFSGLPKEQKYPSIVQISTCLLAQRVQMQNRWSHRHSSHLLLDCRARVL
mmetsp:Transcript_10807/g.26968  ORF Transcript_10807/g.26968 Transcript_10807/m.26968 type:complete len:89 (-) Transcript_10807:857-1123(-)